MLAADRPAFAPARRLHLQRPQTVALLRVTAARVAPAEDRRPAGEELDGAGDGGRLQLRGRQRDRAPEEPPVHRDTLHRARAARREATPVGREAATGALSVSRHLRERKPGCVILPIINNNACCVSSYLDVSKEPVIRLLYRINRLSVVKFLKLSTSSVESLENEPF